MTMEQKRKISRWQQKPSSLFKENLLQYISSIHRSRCTNPFTNPDLAKIDEDFCCFFLNYLVHKNLYQIPNTKRDLGGIYRDISYLALSVCGTKSFSLKKYWKSPKVHTSIFSSKAFQETGSRMLEDDKHSLGTTPLIRQHIFGLFLTHPPTMSA